MLKQGQDGQGNSFNGQEERQEEHDILPQMREKDISHEQAQMQLMRLWSKRQAKALQLEEGGEIDNLF